MQTPDPQIRLAGIWNKLLGRVEVFHDGEWGTVCNNMWDTEDATVVCRLLGLPFSGAQVSESGQFGPGEGRIWLDNVSCDGSEDHLTECGHGGWGNNDCEHTQDAGVICAGKMARRRKSSGWSRMLNIQYVSLECSIFWVLLLSICSTHSLSIR